MLLDRKRINKWAKWVALILAIIFAVGAVGLGVGTGVGNSNVFESLSCSNSQKTTGSTNVDQRIAALNAQLALNPKDVTTLLALATIYEQQKNLTTAASFLEQVIAADPSQKAVYIRLANIYMNQSVANYTAAAAVLNKAISVDPGNPDVYLKLGIAQNTLGNTGAALLAWQKYLSLAPNGDMASVIREQVDKLTKLATTTTTTVGSTSTTSGSTSSTVGAATTSGSAAGTASSTTTTKP